MPIRLKPAFSFLSLVALAASCAPAASTAPAAPSSEHAASVPAGLDGGSPAATSAPSSGDLRAAGAAEVAFARLAKTFLEGYLALTPHEATIAGDHRFDGTWPDWSAAGEKAEEQLIATTRAQLAAVRREALPAQDQVDYAMLENRLALWSFGLAELREREWNALLYTTLLADGLDPLLTREFAPLEERMTSLAQRLRGIPAVVAVAKARLAHAPRVFTETAIAQNKGLVATCKTRFVDELTKAPARKEEVQAAAAKAVVALEELQTFLEKDLLPRSDGDFRLGKARFEKKLAYVLEDDVSPDELVMGARALLAETQQAMVGTALELWPTLMKSAPPSAKTLAEKKALVKRVLDKLAEDRSTNATIVQDATRMLAEATTFVREHDIVRVPEEPCRVIEMPEYRRGVAIAYCDSSGPLEKKQETFYSISPTPKDWSAKRAESFYREYNKSMLTNLTVHEAMPGHYLQAMHANRFHSDIRAVFQNGSFVEGWAVYGEWVLAKHGFGGPAVRLQRQKMTLRLAANAILDHEIHAGTMDEKSALALMMGEAFQEEGEAVGKWKRARLSSAQLSTYYHGLSEMLKLRAAAEKQGPAFKERAYHDKLLSFGAPSFRQLRPLLAK